MPSTTSDIDEHRGEDRPPDAEFRQHGYSVISVDGDLHAVGQVVDVGERDHVAQLHAAENLHPIADAIAGLQLVDGQPIAVDDEHAIDAVAVLHRGVGDRQHLLDERGFEMHARERAGLQQRVVIGRQRLERERPRLGVDGRADPRHRAGERRARKRVHLQVDRLADLDPRRHPLGNLGQQLQRIHAHDGHHRHLVLHELADRHHPLLDVAVERRPDVRVAQLTIGQLHGGVRRRRCRPAGSWRSGARRRRPPLRSQRRLRVVERLLEE